jgi:cell division protein FtsI/penicillin-binding protein 2
MALNDIGLLVRLQPQRGRIYDRNGQLLATNASEFFLEIETIQLTEQSSKDIASVVGELLHLDVEDLEKQLQISDLEDPRRLRLTYKTESGLVLPIKINA